MRTRLAVAFVILVTSVGVLSPVASASEPTLRLEANRSLVPWGETTTLTTTWRFADGAPIEGQATLLQDDTPIDTATLVDGQATWSVIANQRVGSSSYVVRVLLSDGGCCPLSNYVFIQTVGASPTLAVSAPPTGRVSEPLNIQVTPQASAEAAGRAHRGLLEVFQLFQDPYGQRFFSQIWRGTLTGPQPVVVVPQVPGTYTFTVEYTPDPTAGWTPGRLTRTATVTVEPPVVRLPGPDAPPWVTATPGDGEAIVSWGIPASDAPITSYRVEAVRGDETTPVRGQCVVLAPATTCRISGLVNGTAYRFVAQAFTVEYGGQRSAPSAAVTPRAGATNPSPYPRHKFTDVRATHGFDQAVSWMVWRNITTGTTPTLFAPNQAVTRAQMAMFLWRQAGRPSAPDCRFTDHASIPVSVRPAACWLRATGITTTATYYPNRPITRGEAAMFLWRQAGRP